MLLTLTMVDCGGRTEVLGPNTLVDLGSSQLISDNYFCSSTTIGFAESGAANC
jgi:hypothetical protein